MAKNYDKAILKELELLKKQENKLIKANLNKSPSAIKRLAEDKVPKNVYDNLQKVFCKAFGIIFEKGNIVIEKTYNKDEIKTNFKVNEYAFKLKGTRASLKKVRNDFNIKNLCNTAITGAEGIALGVFGIGMPDIVIFVGVILKGIYETALSYGYSYDTAYEKLFILKLMETAMTSGEDFKRLNGEINSAIDSGYNGIVDIEAQTEKTAFAFADDMVVLKFVQGLPVVGVLGGVFNPVYYNKVLRYAELKYRRRYLVDMLKSV